jgi:rhodanese-related sulfurtransferase
MYAGDMECTAVFEILQSSQDTDKPAALVDVRTAREWETIGVADLQGIGTEALYVEWQMMPSMQVNPDFTSQVHQQLEQMGIGKDHQVFFLCRSGARSQSAAVAMTAMGYDKAFNIIGGFEGVPDETGQRGKINGWQADKLPWKMRE